MAKYLFPFTFVDNDIEHIEAGIEIVLSSDDASDELVLSLCIGQLELKNKVGIYRQEDIVEIMEPSSIVVWHKNKITL